LKGFSIFNELIIIDVDIVLGTSLLLIGNSQNKIKATKGRDVIDYCVSEGSNGRGDYTMFVNENTRIILWKPTQLVRRGVWGSEKLKENYKCLRHEVILAPIIEDHIS
jgi:hypothetical protein